MGLTIRKLPMTSRLDTNSGKTLPHLPTRLSESGGWISGCQSYLRQERAGTDCTALLQGILTHSPVGDRLDPSST